MSESGERHFRELPETVTGSRTPPPHGADLIEPSTYLAGEVIGDRYRLVRELGRGGMGVVWVAHSLVLGIDVAVKLIRTGTGGPGVSSRMAREAHAAARLGHPALVRVFDFGWTGRGDPFLVMELVQGETLGAVLAREGAMSAIRAVQALLPIADGLRLAHDRSIVHRDIKPDNILLSSDTLGRRQPKLLDFGIAKIGATPIDGKLTQHGAVLGSPEYMSPEQALGFDDIDERADVWALSVVLYEMLTGKIPFQRTNYNALMHAIINDAPKPTTEYGVADGQLWEVIARGMAKEREQRWHNMTELGEALALWLYEHGIKEDLSGNSVRAVWLDSPLSGTSNGLPPSVGPARTRSITSNRAPRTGETADTAARRASIAAANKAFDSRRRLYVFGVGLASALMAGLIAIVFTPKRTASSSTPELAPVAQRPVAALTAPAAAPVPAPEPASKTAAATEPAPPAARRVTPAGPSKPSSVRRSKKAAIRDFGF
ncbi:MAG TPA: serine/threonine-protein kinase [Polyangiaceae bacterium]|nr:serine/threonine-protein kinase [Polyangiaceae bacterium]